MQESDLIDKQRISKQKPDFPGHWPGQVPTTRDGCFARCPKCGRITALRVCQACKAIMCLDDLTEHQITCLAEK